MTWPRDPRAEIARSGHQVWRLKKGYVNSFNGSKDGGLNEYQLQVFEKAFAFHSLSHYGSSGLIFRHGRLACHEPSLI